LKHRVAAAEISLLLCPEAKSEAVKIIEDSAESGWLLKDCVAVHQMFETTLKDSDAASSKLFCRLDLPIDIA